MRTPRCACRAARAASPPPAAGGWLLPAAGLTRLYVAAPTISVGPAVGGLTTLQSLQLDTWDNRAALECVGCLPPSLTWLYLVGAGLAEVGGRAGGRAGGRVGGRAGGRAGCCARSAWAGSFKEGRSASQKPTPTTHPPHPPAHPPTVTKGDGLAHVGRRTGSSAGGA